MSGKFVAYTERFVLNEKDTSFIAQSFYKAICGYFPDSNVCVADVVFI